MKPLTIRIAGGSLAGLFTAILLQQDGHDVKVYERSSSGLGGRGAGLVPQQDLFEDLQQIGCEDVAHVGVVAKERIYLDASGRVAQRQTTPQMQISWDYLFERVSSRLLADTYRLGHHIDAVREGYDGVTLSFTDGTEERTDLVIGADGFGVGYPKGGQSPFGKRLRRICRLARADTRKPIAGRCVAATRPLRVLHSTRNPCSGLPRAGPAG